MVADPIPRKGQDGEGGGGPGTASAAGYIELKDGRSRFVPAVDPARMFLLVGAATLTGLAIMRPLLGGRGGSRLSWR